MNLLFGNGIACSQGDYIYYSTGLKEGAALYRIKKNGEGLEKLNDCIAQDINVVGEWVYYTNYYDHNKIYRTNIRNKSTEILTSDSVFDILVEDDVIYYHIFVDSYTNHFMKMDTNGENQELILKGKSFVKLNDYILYKKDLFEEHLIIRNLVNDSEYTIEMDSSPMMFALYGEYIYYELYDGNNILYRMDLEGNNKEKLSNYSVLSYNISDDRIYFIDANQKLYKMNLDGTDIKEIANIGKCHRLNIIDNQWIFTIEDTDDVVKLGEGIFSFDSYPYYNTFMLSIDGTGFEIVPTE